MAVPPVELCFELGYHGGIQFLPSRGPPELLLDDLRALVENSPFSDSAESLSAAYLAAKPAGLKHEPSKNACQLEFLSWPKDRLIITDLVSQLVTYVMESNAPRTQIVDLTDDKVAQTEEDGMPALPQPDQNKARSVTSGLSEVRASQIAGPITRLSLREPVMMAGLLAAGFTEPFPVAATTREELIQVLEAWMECYPDESTSGSNLKNHYIAKKISHVKELTFVSTSDHVWVEKFSINALYSGWILKEDDGASMLVEANTANCGGWRGYHAWCGADFGFTSLTIANTGPALNRETASEIEAITKDVELAKGSSPALKLPISQGTNEWGYEKDAVSGTGRGREETARQVLIKKEPNRTAVRQATMRRNQLERQTSEQRWRFETPPLASLDRVKKPRWPPQYVSPFPTRQPKSIRRGCKIVLNAPAIPTSQRSRHRRSSSAESLAVSPRASTRGSSPACNANGRFADGTKTPPPKRPRKETADTPQMPISPVSPFSHASVTRAIPEPAPKINTILHFFLQRRELGALPTPLTKCNTAEKFFNHAEEAWGFLTSTDGATEMAAVSVEVEGVEWPMIIPWKDPLAQKWMMKTIAKAAIGRAHDLHVQVKCITK